jgi:hypothetical protein
MMILMMIEIYHSNDISDFRFAPDISMLGDFNAPQLTS